MTEGTQSMSASEVTEGMIARLAEKCAMACCSESFPSTATFETRIGQVLRENLAMHSASPEALRSNPQADADQLNETFERLNEFIEYLDAVDQTTVRAGGRMLHRCDLKVAVSLATKEVSDTQAEQRERERLLAMVEPTEANADWLCTKMPVISTAKIDAFCALTALHSRMKDQSNA